MKDFSTSLGFHTSAWKRLDISCNSLPEDARAERAMLDGFAAANLRPQSELPRLRKPARATEPVEPTIKLDANLVKRWLLDAA